MARDRAAVDFDGVLAAHGGWKGADHFGEVISEGRDLCRLLRDMNFEIIILTSRMCEEYTPTRSKRERIREGLEQWLKANDVPFDFVWHGIGKPSATAYFDDHAISFDPQHESNMLAHAAARLTKLRQRDL